MTVYCAIDERMIRILTREFGTERVLVNPEALEAYDHDASELRARPEAVVIAESADQVARLMTLANRFRFPVTPRGGATGLAGGCLAVSGGVVLSLERMNRILAIDTMNLVADVEPGVITRDLRQAVEEKGLFYPPDPAGMDKSTIGGNAATGAGGPSCLKYGVTKDYILGLDVVLPTGRQIRTGTHTRKGVVGYDLTHLLVGSEGTLGIITGLTLKLIPKPPSVGALAAAFPDLASAMQTVNDIMMSGHLPSALEFMDYKCLGLVGDMLPFDLSGPRDAVLIVETDGSKEMIDEEIVNIGRICRRSGATRIHRTETEDAREKLWEARRQISLKIHDSSALYLSEDVAVPLGQIADLVGRLPEYEWEYGFTVYAFGHAGDGNIHLNVTAEQAAPRAKVEQGIKALLQLVLGMGGTISGEHGIGKAKQHLIDLELTSEVLTLQRGLKELFDPAGILNPDKIFPNKMRSIA